MWASHLPRLPRWRNSRFENFKQCLWPMVSDDINYDKTFESGWVNFFMKQLCGRALDCSAGSTICLLEARQSPRSGSGTTRTDTQHIQIQPGCFYNPHCAWNICPIWKASDIFLSLEFWGENPQPRLLLISLTKFLSSTGLIRLIVYLISTYSVPCHERHENCQNFNHWICDQIYKLYPFRKAKPIQPYR